MDDIFIRLYMGWEREKNVRVSALRAWKAGGCLFRLLPWFHVDSVIFFHKMFVWVAEGIKGKLLKGFEHFFLRQNSLRRMLLFWAFGCWFSRGFQGAPFDRLRASPKTSWENLKARFCSGVVGPIREEPSGSWSWSSCRFWFSCGFSLRKCMWDGKSAAKMFSDRVWTNGKAGILILLSSFVFSSGFFALFCMGLFGAMSRNAFGSAEGQWECRNPDPRPHFLVSFGFLPYVLYVEFLVLHEKCRRIRSRPMGLIVSWSWCTVDLMLGPCFCFIVCLVVWKDGTSVWHFHPG
jgi:hypothetical protein